jgi:hypothetical protein
VSLPWLRLYAETVDDAKLKLLAFEDRWHYIAILCCKGQGLLDDTKPELLDRIMAAKLGMALADLGEVRRRLMEVDLIDQFWQPLAWEKRQFAGDHSAAERMRRYRAKNGNAPVTKQLRNSDVLDTDTDTDTEEDKNKNPEFKIAGADAPAPTKTKSSASRIPEGWKPSEALIGYATKTLPNVNVFALAEGFIDHWKAKSGADARKADWDAAWRTWVRNALKFGYPMLPLPPQAPRGKREPTEAEISEAQRRAAEDNKRQLQKALGSAFK